MLPPQQTSIANRKYQMNSPAPPKISVILAAYNAEATIAEAVASILNQTHTDFELIIVNDGSTDRTLSVIQSITDSRITLINNSQNLGLVKSLNIGITQAQGEYIARHDADDLSHPDRFTKQIQHLQTHPSIALLGTSRQTLLANGKTRTDKPKKLYPSFTDMLKTNCFVHGSVMIRKSVLAQLGGYDQRFLSSEDYELFLRITQQHTAANLEQPLYTIRRHADRLTQQATDNLILYRLLAKQHALEKVTESTFAEIEQNGIAAYYQHLPTADKIYYHQRLANTYHKNARPAKALLHYRTLQQLQGWKFGIAIKILRLHMKIRRA